MLTKKKVVKKKTYDGINVRFTDKAFKVVKAFCDVKGYKIGAFCEIAALDKVKIESTVNL